MKDTLGTECPHSNVLISLLYGEATPEEKRSFEEHLNLCSQCQQEFNSFQQIRKPLISWRQQSLGSVPDLDTRWVHSESKGKSAVAAIREFFDLSPLWLKGALTVASLLFFAVTIAAIAQYYKTPPPAVSNTRGYTQDELNSLVEARAVALAEEKLAQLKPVAPAPRPSPGETADDRVYQKRKIKSTEVAQNAGTRRPLTKLERDQLAADLRLTTDDESDADLWDDRGNRQEDQD